MKPNDNNADRAFFFLGLCFSLIALLVFSYSPISLAQTKPDWGNKLEYSDETTRFNLYIVPPPTLSFSAVGQSPAIAIG